ncbi:MAG: HD domain-containing protein [Pseudomonadota bacterium]
MITGMIPGLTPSVLAKDFSPHQDLARKLLPSVMNTTEDGAHDISHLMRVWRNVTRLQAVEGGDQRLLTAATILHDCVAVEKDSPDRRNASRLSAKKARDMVAAEGWDADDCDAIAHIIEAHSFSAMIKPQSLEAKILQDADRLDAIGAIGIARCFYVGGRMNSALYHPDDPKAERRRLDDKRYALDHFKAKLNGLADGFQTTTGKTIATERHSRMTLFVDGLLSEITD